MNYEAYFQDLVNGVNNRECDCLICIYDNYMNESRHYDLCGYKMMVWISVENKSCSSRIFH